MRVLAYIAWLALLFAGLRQWPFLWEIGILGAIGGAWWFFWRPSPTDDT